MAEENSVENVIKQGFKPVVGMNANSFDMPLYRYDESGRVVEKRDGGMSLVEKAQQGFETDPEKARVGDYYYDATGNLNVVPNSPTDIYNKYKITKDQTLYEKPTRDSVGSALNLAASAIPTAAIGAFTGAVKGAGAVAGAVPGLLVGALIAGGRFTHGEFEKERAYQNALKEWQKSQEKAIWKVAGNLETTDNGEIVFVADPKKAIGTNMAFAGSEIQKAFNQDTDVRFGDDGRLKVSVNPIFAATDEYKEMVGKVKAAYSGLTKNSDGSDQAIEEIKNYIDNANNQYKFREQSMYSYKIQVPGASDAAIEDAYTNELGAYMSEKDGENYDVKVYRDGEIKTETAKKVLDDFYNMDLGKRSERMLDLFAKMDDPTIPDDDKVYILSEIKLLQDADANDNKYDNGGKQKSVNKYYGMLDQESIISALNNWSVFGDLSATDLINAIDAITPWNMHINDQRGLQEDAAAATSARLISTATSAISSYLIMQGIEHKIIRPVAAKVGAAISSGVDKALEKIAMNPGRVSEFVGQAQMAWGAAKEAISSSGAAIGEASSALIAGARLLSNPLAKALGFSMGELLYNATSDLAFDAGKLGLKALSGEKVTSQEFLEEFGTDLIMDLVMQYGPAGLMQVRTEFDNYRVDQAYEPFRAKIDNAQQKLTEAEVKLNATKQQMSDNRKNSKLYKEAEARLNKEERAYKMAQTAYDKVRTEAEGAIKEALPSMSEELGSMLAGKFAKAEQNSVVMWLRKKFTDEKAGLSVLAEQAYNKTSDVYLYQSAVNKFQSIQSGINEVLSKMKGDFYAKGTGESYAKFANAVATAFPNAKYPKEQANYLVAKAEHDAWTKAANGDADLLAKIDEKYLPYINKVSPEEAKQLDQVLDTMKGFIKKAGESYVNSGAATKQQLKDIEAATVGIEYIPLWGKDAGSKKVGLFETPLTLSVGKTFDQSKGLFDVEGVRNPVESTLAYVHNIANNIARNDMAAMLKEISSTGIDGVQIVGDNGTAPEFQDIIEKALEGVAKNNEKIWKAEISSEDYISGLNKEVAEGNGGKTTESIDKLIELQKRLKQLVDKSNATDEEVIEDLKIQEQVSDDIEAEKPWDNKTTKYYRKVVSGYSEDSDEKRHYIDKLREEEKKAKTEYYSTKLANNDLGDGEFFDAAMSANPDSNRYKVTQARELFRGGDKEASGGDVTFYTPYKWYAETYNDNVVNNPRDLNTFVYNSPNAYNSELASRVLAAVHGTDYYKNATARERMEIDGLLTAFNAGPEDFSRAVYAGNTMGPGAGKEVKIPQPIQDAFKKLGIDAVEIPGELFSSHIKTNSKDGGIGHQTEVIVFNKEKLAASESSEVASQKTQEPSVKIKTKAEWRANPEFDPEYNANRAMDVVEGKASYGEYIAEQKERMWEALKNSNQGSESFLTFDENNNVTGRHAWSNNGSLYSQLYAEYGGRPTKKEFFEAFDDVLKNGEKSKYYDGFKEFDFESDTARMGFNAGNEEIDMILAVKGDVEEALKAKAADKNNYADAEIKNEKEKRLAELVKIDAEIKAQKAQLRLDIDSRIRSAGEYFNKTYGKIGIKVDVEDYLTSSQYTKVIDGKLNSASVENMIALKDDVAKLVNKVAPYLSIKKMNKQLMGKQITGLEKHAMNRLKKDHPEYSQQQRYAIVGQVVSDFKAQLSGDYSSAKSFDPANVAGAYKIPFTLNGTDASFYIKGKLAKEVAAEMTTKNISDRRAISEFFKEAANIKRLLTTGVDPTRVIPNLLRDTIRNGVFSGGTDYWFFDNSPFGFVETFRRMATAMGDTEEHIQKALNTLQTVQEAVSGSTYNEAINGRRTNATKRLIESSSNVGRNRAVKFTWELAHDKRALLEAPMNWAESLTRDRASASAFMRAYLRGGEGLSQEARLNNAYEAGLNAGRENTVNFSRRGAFISEIASYVPYLSQKFSSIESTKIAFLKDPIGVSTRMMMFGAAYMMELSRVLSDDRSRKNYYNLSEYDRENNIVLSLGRDGGLVTIPLDETISALIYPWRRGLETMHNVDPESFYMIMVNGFLELSPFDLSGFTEGDSFNFGRGIEKLAAQTMPTIVQAAWQQLSGRSLYYGSNIRVSKEQLAEYGNYNPTFGDYTTTGKNSALLRSIADALGIEQWRLQQGIADLGGNVGQYVVNWLDKVAGAPEDAQGGKEFVDATFKSFTGMDSEQVKYAFDDGIEQLTVEKEKLKGKLIEMNNQISLSSGERMAELQEQYRKVKQDFAMKVGNFVDKYINAYEIAGGLTKAQANKIWYLLNFSDDDSIAMGGSVESYYRDLAKKQGNNDATKYSANILDKYYDQTKNVYKDSSGEWHYYSPYGEQAFFNTVQGRGMEYQVGLRNIIEGKVNDLSSARSAAYDARSAAADAQNWDEYDKIGLKFDEQVLQAIAPYVKKYGADNVLTNSSVLDYLEEWFFVPSSYMKSKYGKNVSLAHNASKQRAFVRPYIKELFGLSTAYQEKEYASRPEHLVRGGE